MPLLRRAGVVLRSKVTNRTPSKRARPPKLPIQRYPSVVCTIEVTVFWGRPLAVVQLSRLYWVTALPGSRPAAHAGAAARTRNDTRRAGDGRLIGRRSRSRRGSH